MTFFALTRNAQILTLLLLHSSPVVANSPNSECTATRLAETLARIRARAPSPIAGYQLVHYQGMFTLRTRQTPELLSPQYAMIQRPYLRLRSDCPEAQVNQLRDLLGAAFPSLTPAQVHSFANAARERDVYLQELLPPRLQENLNQRASCDGPNCWNATLMWFDPNAREEYTEIFEIEDYLRRHTTRLQEGAPLQMGDILVTRRQGSITHTAVYIGGDVLFHKPGTLATRRWVFDTLENMVATYLWHIDNTLEVRRRNP